MMGPYTNLAQRQSLAQRCAHTHAHTHPHTHTDGTEPSLGSTHSDWMNHKESLSWSGMSWKSWAPLPED